MGKYIKLFNTHAEYENARQNLILPNVSLCAQENEVHYNPWVETRVVAKYNVTDTSSPTKIGYYQYVSGFSEIEIDGVVQPSVVSAYTFSTTGEHTVKYTLTDPTTIVYSAFANCTSLTSITIPDSVTSISSDAFEYCSGMTSIDIPDSVTSIGSNVFTSCDGLTSVTIGSGVTYIGWLVFVNCKNITNMIIRAATPPALERGQSSSPASDTFSGSYPIYVPSESVNDYKAAQYWSRIESRIQAMP